MTWGTTLPRDSWFDITVNEEQTAQTKDSNAAVNACFPADLSKGSICCPSDPNKGFILETNPESLFFRNLGI